MIDDKYGFVLTKTAWFSPLCAVKLGELMGLHTTLKWGSNLQFDNVDFVLNSKKFVDFRTDLNDNIEFGCIICACEQLF